MVFCAQAVPVVDVEVGAADAGLEDANFDVVDAGLGFGDVREPETFFGVGHLTRALPLAYSLWITYW